MNCSVRVKLTRFGEQVMDQRDRDLNNLYEKAGAPARVNWRELRRFKEDGLYYDQLWSLMRIFGPSIHMGMPEAPFTSIELDLSS